jgi:hypothetical protein
MEKQERKDVSHEEIMELFDSPRYRRAKAYWKLEKLLKEQDLPELIKDYFECSYAAYKMDKENQHELEGHH